MKGGVRLMIAMLPSYRAGDARETAAGSAGVRRCRHVVEAGRKGVTVVSERTHWAGGETGAIGAIFARMMFSGHRRIDGLIDHEGGAKGVPEAVDRVDG